LALLSSNAVQLVVDVRTVPASRRMPHFAGSALQLSLPEHGIAYRQMPDLGGLRKPKLDSINTGWRNTSFRGFADYMREESFWRALATLEQWARERGTVIMCAEAVPWRCHRSLISDALTLHGVEVRHIISKAAPSLHAITPFARVDGERILYPAADTLPM
jgi:uncharacterized protein (DUF488 family)